MSPGAQLTAHLVLSLLAAACLLVLPAAPARPDTVRDCDFGAPDVAIPACTALIQKDPKDPVAYNQRGNAYASKNEHERAIADFTKGIEIKPSHPDHYYNRGNSYRLTKRQDQAIVDYTRAIELKKDQFDFHFNRGLSYALNAEHQRAIADFAETLRIQPRTDRSHYRRGISYEALGDYGNAIEDFTKAIEYRPFFSSNFYLSRALAYSSVKKYAEGLADTDRVLKEHPRDYKAHTVRGEVFERMGRRSDAIAAYRKAQQIFPGHESSGDALKRLGAAP